MFVCIRYVNFGLDVIKSPLGKEEILRLLINNCSVPGFPYWAALQPGATSQ